VKKESPVTAAPEAVAATGAATGRTAAAGALAGGAVARRAFGAGVAAMASRAHNASRDTKLMAILIRTGRCGFIQLLLRCPPVRAAGGRSLGRWAEIPWPGERQLSKIGRKGITEYPTPRSQINEGKRLQ